MSEVRKTFLDLLHTRIAGEGYSLNKSTGVFEKKRNELLLSLVLSWDGRGGLTFINGVDGQVSVPYVGVASKKLIASVFDARIFHRPTDDAAERRFPQMYSKELLELANGMKFKEMAAMSFESKYPRSSIERAVDYAARYIKEEVIPFHGAFNSDLDVLENYVRAAEKQLAQGDHHNLFHWVFPIKLICKKNGIPEPTFIQRINIFTDRSIDDLWNMQSYDHAQLEQRFNTCTF
jgi:hypothetical protein